jgi:hypothetical protein
MSGWIESWRASRSKLKVLPSVDDAVRRLIKRRSAAAGSRASCVAGTRPVDGAWCGHDSMHIRSAVSVSARRRRVLEAHHLPGADRRRRSLALISRSPSAPNAEMFANHSRGAARRRPRCSGTNPARSRS